MCTMALAQCFRCTLERLCHLEQALHVCMHIYMAPAHMQVAAACEHTGFFAVSGHGCDMRNLNALMQHGRAFFDSSSEYKDAHIVDQMRVGRGYEISPEHRGYEDLIGRFLRAERRCSNLRDQIRAHEEPSVRQGRMSGACHADSLLYISMLATCCNMQKVQSTAASPAGLPAAYRLN